MVERRERGVEFLKMVFERVLRIDVKRGAKFFGERFHAHAFAKQLVTGKMKIMHAREFNVRAAKFKIWKSGFENKKPAGNFFGGLVKLICLRLGDNRGALRVVLLRRNLVGLVAGQ